MTGSVVTIETAPPFMDRTARLLNDLAEEKVGVRPLDAAVGLTADSAALNTATGLRLTGFAINLLARTFARVFLLPPIGTTHLTTAYREFEAMWGFPWTGIHAGTVQPGSDADVVLAIGKSASNGGNAAITIGCHGWVAECQRGAGPLSVSDDQNPVSYAVAACLGVAKVFSELVMRELPSGLRSRFQGPPSIRWSVHSYKDEEDPGPPIPSDLRLEDVVLVGLGGVGSAITAVLALCPKLSGRILLVDPDQVDESNLNRFLTAKGDAIGRQKSEVVHDHLAARHPQLQVLGLPLAYQAAVRQVGHPRGMLVSSVDTESLRAFMQSDLPRLVIDAATSGPIVGLSRHTFLEGACLGCIHPRSSDPFSSELQMARLLGQPLSFVIERLADDKPLLPQELRALGERLHLDVHFSKGKPLRAFWAEDVCGKVEIPAAAAPEPTSGSAAFVSALAGALAAGEVVKSLMQTHTLDNELKLQVFKGPDPEFPRRRMKDPKCSCFCADPVMHDAYLRLHPSLWLDQAK